MWRPHSNWLLGHDDSPGCVSRARPQAPLRCLTPPQRGRQGSTALSQLASTHAHETLLWASKGKGARHTFNYDLINGRDPTAQISSVWRIPAVPPREKTHGYHPTQKPLRLLRRSIVACTEEGELVFDPFCGSGTTGVAAKEPPGASSWGRRGSGSTPSSRDAGSGRWCSGECHRSFPASSGVTPRGNPRRTYRRSCLGLRDRG